MVLSVVLLLVVGLVVGALARAVVPGRQTLPVWLTMVAVAWCAVAIGLCLSAADPAGGRPPTRAARCPR